ncbi:MAG: hypothetical protein V1867_02880 [Candidatus Falkowbacteria bacterium]
MSKESKDSAQKLLSSSQKIVRIAELEELKTDTDRLFDNLGALIVKTTRYSRKNSVRWKKLGRFVKAKNLSGVRAIGRMDDFQFEAKVENDFLKIRFDAFGYEVSVDLKSGAVAGQCSLDILYALSVSPKFFEPVYWQDFYQKASQKG